MSGNDETKVQQLVDTVKCYGKPMYIFLRVITWELPLSWGIIFAACSILYVILHNLTIKGFSVLGLLALWLDYYCRQNNIAIPELTESEKDYLPQISSKVIAVQTKVTEILKRHRVIPDSNVLSMWLMPDIYGYIFTVYVATWFIDNLLLCYLIGLAALLMVGMSCPQTDSV